MPRVYVGYIHVEATVAAKIMRRAEGGCTPDEVREAFQGRAEAELRVKPGTDPTEVAGFGETASGRRLFASMVALDEPDGTWSLQTAWPV